MVWDREKIRASLTRKGFRQRKDRDHDVLTLHADGLRRAIWTKLSRSSGHKVYGNKLLGEMCVQLFVTRKQLNRLIECDMKQPEYLDVLRSRRVLG